MHTKTIRPGLTAATAATRALLAAGWRYDSTSPMADDTTIRTLLHPSGREIHARTDDRDGDTTSLTMTGLSLEQVAGAITGAGLTGHTSEERAANVDLSHAGVDNILAALANAGIEVHYNETDGDTHLDIWLTDLDAETAWVLSWRDTFAGWRLAEWESYGDDTEPDRKWPIAGGSPAEVARDVASILADDEQPKPELDLRRVAYDIVLAGVAAGMPIPDMIDIPSGYDIFELKMGDNDQASADAWAAYLDLPKPSFGSVIRGNRRHFRNYGAESWKYPALPGWKVEVSSYVDEPAEGGESR